MASHYKIPITVLFLVIVQFSYATATEDVVYEQMKEWIKSQVSGLDQDFETPEMFMEKYAEILVALESNKTTNDLMRQQFEKYDIFKNSPRPKIPPFTCPVRPRNTLKFDITADQLQPGHISIVAAMGDSLTAGTGLLSKTLVGAMLQNQGHTFAIGGDENYEGHVTIPNLLKKYNPDLRGFSFGSGVLLQRGRRYNVAVPGNKATEMPEQARILVDRMRMEEGAKYFTDWKLVTLMIGGNDLCAYCFAEDKYSIASYKKNIQDALDTLYREMPRVFVNLLEVVDVRLVQESQHGGTLCKLLHNLLLCRCVTEAKGNPQLTAKLNALLLGYQKAVRDLANDNRYKGRKDFVIVSQPTFRKASPGRDKDGKLDMSWFTPDCFHLNRKGHTLASLEIWRNMFQPVGKKDDNFSLEPRLTCPPYDGVLKTAENSK